MKSTLILINIVFLLTLQAFAQLNTTINDHIPSLQQTQTRISTVLADPSVQALGYPFNNRAELSNPLTLSIAERLSDINGALAGAESDESQIWRIINDNMPTMREGRSFQGIMNDGAFAKKCPEIQTDLLMAALSLVAHQGHVYNVIPLLRLSNIHIGDSSKALGDPSKGISGPPSVGSMADIHAALSPSSKSPHPAPLSEDDQLALWPAAAAIIHNPTDAKPQLLSVLVDVKHSNEIRLRAASFLNQIDASVLTSDVLDSLDEVTRSKVACITLHNIRWRQLITDPCALYSKELQERWEQFKKQRETMKP
ncbi:MAG: hypothetical protein GC154_15855 [bacterium]|nr:hypothetical protein [bacterium]